MNLHSLCVDTLSKWATEHFQEDHIEPSITLKRLNFIFQEIMFAKNLVTLLMNNIQERLSNVVLQYDDSRYKLFQLFIHNEELLEIVILFIKLSGKVCFGEKTCHNVNLTENTGNCSPLLLNLTRRHRALPFIAQFKEDVIEEVKYLTNITDFHFMPSCKSIHSPYPPFISDFVSNPNLQSVKLSFFNDVYKILNKLSHLKCLNELHLMSVEFSEESLESLKLLKTLHSLYLRNITNITVKVAREISCQKVLPNLQFFHWSSEPLDWRNEELINDEKSLSSLFKEPKCSCDEFCFSRLTWIHIWPIILYSLPSVYESKFLPDKYILPALGIPVEKYNQIMSEYHYHNRIHCWVLGKFNVVREFKMDIKVFLTLSPYLNITESTISYLNIHVLDPDDITEEDISLLDKLFTYSCKTVNFQVEESPIQITMHQMVELFKDKNVKIIRGMDQFSWKEQLQEKLPHIEMFGESIPQPNLFEI